MSQLEPIEGGPAAPRPAPSPLDLIRKPETVGVREVWSGEASVFTPWLAENLDLLDILGMERLSLVDTEVSLPSTWRALDILAETPGGERVAIENQFGILDHDHLTRGLAYAVGLQSQNVSALVVIAEAHRPEFVAVADYLNLAAEALGTDANAGESRERGIGVFLVQLSVERIDRWFVPRFQVLARPNRWLEEVARTVGRDHLASVDEFVSKLPDERRPSMRDLIAGWGRLPGARVTHNSRQAVALRLTKPAGESVAAFTLYIDGSCWLSRGGLLDGGPHRETDAEITLDRQIESDFPDGMRGEKNYYVTLRTPSETRILEFGAWAVDWLATTSGTPGEK